MLAKQLPLTEEELLESLVFLIKENQWKNRSIELLKGISAGTKLNYIEKSDANHRVAFFLILEALGWKNNKIIARAILNQALPYEFLIKIAEKGDASMLELLLDNQIKLIAYPEILEAMEKNPEITNFIRGKIREIREFYLQQDIAEEITVEEVMEEVREVILQEQMAERKQRQAEGEETDEDENAADEGLEEIQDAEVHERALTTLQEINNMAISDRIKLALTGTKTHRMILVKDANKIVSLAVLESPKITLDEVIILAKNKSVATDIIARISRNREWIKNYSIIAELVQNPKTPIKSALSFINRLHLRDLKLLSANKNTNPVIRQFAANLFSQRVRTVKQK